MCSLPHNPGSLGTRPLESVPLHPTAQILNSLKRVAMSAPGNKAMLREQLHRNGLN